MTGCARQARGGQRGGAAGRHVPGVWWGCSAGAQGLKDGGRAHQRPPCQCTAANATASTRRSSSSSSSISVSISSWGSSRGGGGRDKARASSGEWGSSRGMRRSRHWRGRGVGQGHADPGARGHCLACRTHVHHAPRQQQGAPAAAGGEAEGARGDRLGGPFLRSKRFEPHVVEAHPMHMTAAKLTAGCALTPHSHAATRSAHTIHKPPTTARHFHLPRSKLHSLPRLPARRMRPCPRVSFNRSVRTGSW